MKTIVRIAPFILFSAFVGAIPTFSSGQAVIENLGLDGRQATSISTYGSIVAVGTDGHGVYWQSDTQLADSGWAHIELDSLSVLAVYAHKSGPIGWAISAGIESPEPGTPLIYCSYLGGAFTPNGYGILDSLTSRITSISGFPDPTKCGETYAAGDRVLYQRDFGDSTWTPVYEATIEGNIQTVAARPQYPGVVMAGGADGFAGHLLVKSTNFGETWEDISPIHAVESVDFAGEKGDVIFAVNVDQVSRSLDGGTTWSTVLADSSKHDFKDVLFDSGSKRVFVSSTSNVDGPGIFFSSDVGDSWHLLAVPGASVIEDMTFGRGSDWVYFVTRTGGVYKLDRITVGVEIGGHLDEATFLNPNFPNPVVSSTEISYSIPSPSRVEVEIHDLLGRLVASWTHSRSSRGRYSVTWNSGDAANGLYFYSIRTPNATRVRTLVLSR